MLKFDFCVLNDFTVLNIQSADPIEPSIDGAIVGEKLRDDCERLLRVNSSVQTIVFLCAECVWVEAASCLVTYAMIAAIISGALVESRLAARMRCQLRRPRIRFP